MNILKNFIAPLLALATVFVITTALLGMLFVWIINTTLQVSARENDVVYICKPTSSETNPWNVIGIDESALETHVSNGAFLYEGEYENNGRPHPQRSAAWCAEQVEDEEVVTDDKPEKDEAVPEKEDETRPPRPDDIDRGLDGDTREITNNPRGDSITREVAEKFEQQEITEGK